MFHCEAHFVRTHDLLEIEANVFIARNASAPGWVDEALRKTPFVIVRRGRTTDQEIPIGVRGAERNQRWAAFCHPKWLKEHPHPSATPDRHDSSIAGRCRTCSSRLTGSQRSLDGPRSPLGTWRQRWLRARNWPACGKARKRSRCRDFRRGQDNKRAGKVASGSDDEPFGSCRYSCGDTRMRLLPHRIRTREGRRHSIAYSRRTRTQRRSLEL